MKSIATIAVLFALLVGHITPAHAQVHSSGRLILPELGNTAQSDRILKQEITDEHIAPPKPRIIAKASRGEPDLPLTTQNLDNAESNVSAWDRIRISNRIPRQRNERVDFYLDQYQRELLWINKILNRGTPYIGYIVEALDDRFMPIELAVIPAIESGFQANAKSAFNAAGIWQIVPVTAKEIGVRRNSWFDGRGDIVTSTTAALDYLSYLNAEFNGNWELTLAAYNAGIGRVRSAIRKNKKAGKPTDFWSLDLPTETKNYVPKIVAMLELIKDPSIKGLKLPDLPASANFTKVDVGKRISLDQAAEIAGLNEQLLRQLNGGLIHAVTGPKGPHKIVVPTDAVSKFEEAIAQSGDTRLYSLPKTHKVKSGDTLSAIALAYGVSQRKLRELNGLDNGNIRIGQRLAVLDFNDIGTGAIGTGNGDNVEYVVKIGDTLSEIAQRFSVRVSTIRNSRGNLLKNKTIHPGDVLLIAGNQTAG